MPTRCSRALQLSDGFAGNTTCGGVASDQSEARASSEDESSHVRSQPNLEQSRPPSRVPKRMDRRPPGAGTFIDEQFRCGLPAFRGYCSRSLTPRWGSPTSNDPRRGGEPAWIGIEHQLAEEATQAPLTNPGFTQATAGSQPSRAIVRIVLVSADFGREITTAVRWLTASRDGHPMRAPDSLRT